MSGETLRRAARRLRHDVDFGQAHGDDTFLLSVADWLDVESHAPETPIGDGITVGGPSLQALVVARTYLGEAS